MAGIAQSPASLLKPGKSIAILIELPGDEEFDPTQRQYNGG
jgi:hypothetical protein